MPHACRGPRAGDTRAIGLHCPFPRGQPQRVTITRDAPSWFLAWGDQWKKIRAYMCCYGNSE